MINIKALLGLEYYTSELDEFLKNFDKNHPKLSASQRQEIAKYKRIYKLRDNSVKIKDKKSFWDNF